ICWIIFSAHSFILLTNNTLFTSSYLNFSLRTSSYLAIQVQNVICNAKRLQSSFVANIRFTKSVGFFN
ncbi:MAG: hypothetical protein ACJBCI_03395, partial [Candidatus Tisiphia sp.]